MTKGMATSLNKRNRFGVEIVSESSFSLTISIPNQPLIAELPPLNPSDLL